MTGQQLQCFIYLIEHFLQTTEDSINLFIRDNQRWFNPNGVGAGQCTCNQYATFE